MKTMFSAIFLMMSSVHFAAAEQVKLNCDYMNYSCNSPTNCDWEYPGVSYSLAVDVKPTGEPNHWMGYTFLPDHSPQSADSVGVEIDQIRKNHSIKQSIEVNLIVNKMQVRATGEQKVETTFWNSVTPDQTHWGRQLKCEVRR